MRKGLVVLMAALLVAAFALPAMADTSVTGFYRAKGHFGNYKLYGAKQIAADVPSSSFVEQRLRAKIGIGDENVKAFYFAEFDMAFGDSSAGGRGTGAALGADANNMETKNLYVWFKVPNTTFDFTVGLQNQSDSYAGILFGVSDMAGVFTNFKVDPVSLRLGWAKWYEGDSNEADDVDLYVAEAKLTPAKDVKLGLNLYYLNTGKGSVGAPTTGADSGSVKVYVPGIDFSAKAGPVGLTGFLFYQSGTVENTGVPDVDIKAYAGDLRADLALGPGKAFFEGLFISGGDGSAADEYESIVSAADFNTTQVFFYRTDMQILMPNADDINTSMPLTANYSNGGRGLIHLAAGYSQKFTDKFSGKLGLGYLMATEMLESDPDYKDKGMATEVNFNVNYNIAKGLDLGLYGAFAFLGDFYAAAPGASDPDDPYDLYARLNYAF